MKSFYLFMLTVLFPVLLSSCEQGTSLNDENNDLAPGTSLTVSSVDQFFWKKGNSSWIQDSRDRLWSSTFIFKSGGKFTYTFDWDSASTYTLNGEYFGSDGEYTFYAFRTTNNGAGSGTQVLVNGTITEKANGTGYSVEMEYGSSANYAAIVNNQQFLSQASKLFQTTMTVK